MPLDCFLQTTFSDLTGIDSTSLEICYPNRAKQYKVLKAQTGWGKSFIRYYLGLKLHLIINDKGAFLAVTLTPGNTND